MKKTFLLITVCGLVFSGCAVRKITSIKTVSAGPMTVRPMPLTADLNVSDQKVRGVAEGKLTDGVNAEDRLMREAVARALGQDPPKAEAPDALVAMNVYKEVYGKNLKVVVTGYPAWYHNFRNAETKSETKSGDLAWLVLLNNGVDGFKHGGGGLPFIAPGQANFGKITRQKDKRPGGYYLGVGTPLLGSRTVTGEWAYLEGGWRGGTGMEYGFEFGAGFAGDSESSRGESTTIGGGFNISGQYSLPADIKLVCGVSAGFWYGNWLRQYNYSMSHVEISQNDFLFGGPFIKARWKFIELSYRGLMGYSGYGDGDYNHDDYDDGFTWASQFKFGLHFEL
jgi:hypothetical protein